ncbi:hypothetical protein [Paenibacillus thermotolerans]|uniref:hypothetical protein n=1 Tax=Paenibacillus thermotolerans TaxID=3027807 RepID=UPI0023675DD3|nr:MULTISPECIES: hypothetical protein [unclassified Paenibacillus]
MAEPFLKKIEFLRELEEIIEDRIFIGNAVDKLKDEITNNCWSISMSQELAGEFAVQDLQSIFEKILQNRIEQAAGSDCSHGMIFYVWFEWQSARLRFNLISDIHAKLPFGGKYNVIENIEPIIREFLSFPYHDGIPSIEAEEEVDDLEAEKEIKPFDVYVVNLPKAGKARNERD